MKLTAHSIENITPFLIFRKGKQLVNLLNDHGFLDHYDDALPDIGKANGQRPSKTQYLENRLSILSGKQELRDVLNVLINELPDANETIPKLNAILQKENYHIAQIDGGYAIQGGVIEKKLPIKNEAHFLDIQNQILSYLGSAKVSIWVAMAWFTNKVLFDKLIEKLAEGLDIFVAIYDDGINKKYGVDLEKLPHVRVNGSRGGFMHNKFCVIDNQTVITGSYNWSTNAETKNDENIAILEDPKTATKYSLEFKQLIGPYK